MGAAGAHHLYLESRFFYRLSGIEEGLNGFAGLGGHIIKDRALIGGQTGEVEAIGFVRQGCQSDGGLAGLYATAIGSRVYVY